MNDADRTRPLRADARESIARILDAAQEVYAGDPNASLDRVAQVAGVARATVHRHFSSRQVLLDALVRDQNRRYREALEQARVTTVPPLVAFYRVVERIFELKLARPFVLSITPGPEEPGSPASDPEIAQSLDLLLRRLHTAGDITVDDTAWGRRVCLALLHEAHELPAGSPALSAPGSTAPDDVGARVDLVVRSVIGALGGDSR
ncbi:TetR/AcrR family transcriptional regulator [Brachybacterium sp. GCM10030267]|uniref:TetR/AcrR family transcriptional regulator n=1 Tax=unclassified Brachybacterium TaxID=2623841 RepID=UPI00360E66FC